MTHPRLSARARHATPAPSGRRRPRAQHLASLAISAVAVAALVVPALREPSPGSAAAHAHGGHDLAPAAAYVPEAPILDRAGWTAKAPSTTAGHAASDVLDAATSTYWQAGSVGTTWLQVALPGAQIVSGVVYQPSGVASAGRIGRFRVATSTDARTWSTAATGTWADDDLAKRATFAAVPARYLRLTALGEAADRPLAVGASELDLLGKPTITGTTTGATTIAAAPVSYATGVGAAAAAVSPSRGSWSPTITFPLVPVSAALLPNDKVLLWAAASTTDWTVGSGRTETAILDLATQTVSSKTVVNTGHDMFCPGVAILPDGRIMVTGGVDAGSTSIYDPDTDTWLKGPAMNLARGYHSMTTLADGSVFTIGGSWSGGVGNKGGEVWTMDGGWRPLPSVPVTPILTADPRGESRSDNHTWLFSMSGGRLLHAGPSKRMNWITTAGSGSITSAGTRADSDDAMNGNAVMYDVDKLLTLGGAPAYDNSNATNRAYVVNAAGATPLVSRTGDLVAARAFTNSVALPDGSVLAIGGQGYALGFTDTTATLAPELWSPTTGTFTAMAPQPTPRTYHSWALLLPDGRVLSGGGGLCGGCATNHPDAQIFTPPYLLNADGTSRPRPAITAAPTSTTAGATITVTTAQPVSSFSMVRVGEATHSVDNDQRRVPLTVVSSQPVTGGTRYTLAPPTDPGVLLAGPWMLFALDGSGTPSTSRRVAVTLPGAAERPSQFAPAPTTTSVPQGAVNLALGKPATQSTNDVNNPGAVAGRAVDGNTDGRWSNGSVTHTMETEQQAWWQVDLGSVQPVGAVQLWNRTDCCSERLSYFSVLTSTSDMTGRTYQQLFADPSISVQRVSTLSGPSATLPLTGNARYVRVQLSALGGVRPLSLAEVQVYGSSASSGPGTGPATGGATTNLAQGRPTSQSSIDINNGLPARAVDGNTDGIWTHGSVTHTDLQAQPWWQVDLGGNVPVDRVVLWNRTDCCTDRLNNGTVFLSTTDPNGRTYDQLQADPAVVKLPYGTLTGASLTLAAQNAKARYVRVQLAGTNILSLAEVQVYSSATPPPTTGGANLATGRPATQSSIDINNGLPGRAVDGNTDGIWTHGSVTHTDLQAQPWWQVDLGGSVPVDRVVLWNRTDCCTDRLNNGTVFLSTTDPNGRTYDQLQADPAVVKLPYGTVTNPTVTLPANGATARYVRVQLAGTNILSLAEVQVYSSATPPPTTGGADLATGRPATQSSIDIYNGVPGRAVDGNTDGIWAHGSVTHTSQQTQPWWQVDLGTAAAIDRVLLWNRLDCCSDRLNNGTVFLSTTDMTGRTYDQLQADPAVVKLPYGTVTNPTVTLPANGATARYVRVQLAGSNILSLAEVQVLAR